MDLVQQIKNQLTQKDELMNQMEKKHKQEVQMYKIQLKQLLREAESNHGGAKANATSSIRQRSGKRFADSSQNQRSFSNLSKASLKSHQSKKSNGSLNRQSNSQQRNKSKQRSTSANQWRKTTPTKSNFKQYIDIQNLNKDKKSLYQTSSSKLKFPQSKLLQNATTLDQYLE